MLVSAELGQRHVLSGMRLQKIVPPRLEVHHAQIGLQKLFTVKIMAIVNHYFYTGIQPVDEIPPNRRDSQSVPAHSAAGGT